MCGGHGSMTSARARSTLLGEGVFQVVGHVADDALDLVGEELVHGRAVAVASLPSLVRANTPKPLPPAPVPRFRREQETAWYKALVAGFPASDLDGHYLPRCCR